MSDVRCGKRFVVLKKRVNSSFIFGFFPVLCKSWNCEKCRSVKARIVRNYVKKHFSGSTIWILTFTMFHSGDPGASFRKISSAWNRFRLEATRRFGKFSYIRILEPHKKGGWPHMHVLVNACITDSVILKKLTKMGFGWNFESQQISTNSAMGYVSKYLTKGWDNLNADYLRRLTKARIVSVSRDLPPVFYRESTWECIKNDVPDSDAHFIHSSIITYLHFEGAGFVDSSPCFGGFVIHSDIDIDIDKVFDHGEPYVWDYCDKWEYKYLWGVMQTDIFSSNYMELMNRKPQNYSESQLHINLRLHKID